MFLAIVGALLIGLSLGMLGSGGSILTVPVLIHLVGQDEKIAIAGSLAIVGTISLFAAIPYAVGRLVDYRSVLFFGVPGMAGAHLGAYLARFVSGATQLIAFSGLMLVAAYFMLRPALEGSESDVPRKRSVWFIGLEGVLVGAVTGFVGVGGGFLIVPALVILGGLPMHRAIGTSLLIITLKSYAGFLTYRDVLAELGLRLDLSILGLFSAVGVLGSIAGHALGHRLPKAAVKRVFGVFLILVSVFLVGKHWPA